MSLEKSFCPSPWFHMRINNSGSYEWCRWKVSAGSRVNFDHNLKNQSPLDYFQNTMAPLRQEFLNGNQPAECSACYTMEQHNKVSGRQRQLLKVGVLENHFNKSLASSPMRPDFDYSNDNQGHTLRTVTDWQIDLGNYCNGRCIFCVPESSSSLAAEFKKIGLIDQTPPQSWPDNPELLKKFIDDLLQSPKLQYLHFIGGETVITPGFKAILSALVDAGISKNITVGFTTNLTVWSNDIVELLKQFKQVNLGLSIETLTVLNDYVRYPAKQEQTHRLLKQWTDLGRNLDWLIQLRITPTCLTVHEIDTVYDYAWNNNLAVESCNFLYKPEYLRIEVLPLEQRQSAVDRLAQWVNSHAVNNDEKVINTRDPNRSKSQVIQDAQSYLNYLKNTQDESYRLPNLISYLKTLETNRGNSILNYLPQYEELFRTQGY
jgi:sulfatase maturation enzyme AslB (radical SAM superfamily)